LFFAVVPAKAGTQVLPSLTSASMDGDYRPILLL